MTLHLFRDAGPVSSSRNRPIQFSRTDENSGQAAVSGAEEPSGSRFPRQRSSSPSAAPLDGLDGRSGSWGALSIPCVGTVKDFSSPPFRALRARAVNRGGARRPPLRQPARAPPPSRWERRSRRRGRDGMRSELRESTVEARFRRRGGIAGWSSATDRRAPAPVGCDRPAGSRRSVRLPTRSQMTFGGEPSSSARRLKSSSFETTT